LSACGGEAALRGRIALPGDVSCRMLDTAGGTPALPYEEAASSISSTSMLSRPPHTGMRNADFGQSTQRASSSVASLAFLRRASSANHESVICRCPVIRVGLISE